MHVQPLWFDIKNMKKEMAGCTETFNCFYSSGCTFRKVEFNQFFIFLVVYKFTLLYDTMTQVVCFAKKFTDICNILQWERKNSNQLLKCIEQSAFFCFENLELQNFQGTFWFLEILLNRLLLFSPHRVTRLRTRQYQPQRLWIQLCSGRAGTPFFCKYMYVVSVVLNFT